jgi:ABC-2 type transport system permease protein
LAVGSYLVAYWLRFRTDPLAGFQGDALIPSLVVTLQLGGFIAVGAYARRLGFDWLTRVVAGVVAGSIGAGILIFFLTRFEDVSVPVLVAASVLLTISALAWRSVWILRSRAKRQAAAETLGGNLVDRTAQIATLKSVVWSLYGYRELLKNLVMKDLKLKYRGSVFGFLWSLVNPLLMTVVYTIAFTFILRVRTEGFQFYLMLGLLSWTFFSSSAGMSTGAIIDNSTLLKSVLFPRAILPVATVLFNLAQYLLTVSVFLPAMVLLYQVPLSAPMLLFPLFLGLQVVFTIGIALILATATAFFRDVRHLLEVALAVLFWATPIVYELRQVPEDVQFLLLLGPVAPFVVAYQQLIFYREWPDAAVWLMASVHAIGALLIGLLLFLTFEDQFTEQL